MFFWPPLLFIEMTLNTKKTHETQQAILLLSYYYVITMLLLITITININYLIQQAWLMTLRACISPPGHSLSTTGLDNTQATQTFIVRPRSRKVRRGSFRTEEGTFTARLV